MDGRDVTNEETAKRNLSAVFQSHALYPNMTVSENVAFPLKVAGKDPTIIEARVTEAARFLNLNDYLTRKPRQLSGGQRQRVAIARAIVHEPAALLLDEPLSGLNPSLRSTLRTEILELHQRLGKTIVYATQDEIEAMTLAEKIVVLRDGRIEQVGSPLELYRIPKNLFVAGYFGTPKMNFIQGAESEKRGATTIGVRPEDTRLAVEAGIWQGTFSGLERHDSGTFARVDAGELGILYVQFSGELPIHYGDTVYVTPDQAMVHKFGAGGLAI